MEEKIIQSINLCRFGVFCESQPVGHPFAMGVHNHTLPAKTLAHHGVCDFPAHPRQFQQFLHGAGHLAIVFFQQYFAGFLD